ERAVEGPVTENRLEVAEPPGAAPDLEDALRQHGDARGVVAAVLEPLEPLQDEGGRPLAADVAHDSTHGPLSLAFDACSGPALPPRVRSAFRPVPAAPARCLAVSAPGGLSNVRAKAPARVLNGPLGSAPGPSATPGGQALNVRARAPARYLDGSAFKRSGTF